MSDVQRAIDKQAKLEAEATPGPWQNIDGYRVVSTAADRRVGITDEGGVFNPQSEVHESDGALIAHLRNQAKLARAVIEAASQLLVYASEVGDQVIEDALSDVVAAFADHVNGETP